MMYSVYISSVDGETEYTVQSSSLKIIEQFLKHLDHEGSSISFSDDSDIYYGERVYQRIHELKKQKEESK